MLNGSSLNSHAINSLGFTSAEGGGALISLEQYVGFEESGSLGSIKQTVYHVGVGALVDIYQEVELQISESGSLITISQDVISEGVGSILNLGQQVVNAAALTFFDKNGWDLSISVGGLTLSRDIIQEAEVVHGINDDARATVKLNPGAATYDLYSYQGKELIISARTGSTFQRIFTGIVDIPKVELINEKIIIEGVASRETLIRNLMTPHVAGIGYYSETVFGSRDNVFKEINDRMQTIPADLDFDANNNWSVTSWTPKTAPDLTLVNSDLYREQQPEVRIESAREIINKVSINLNYGYQRLHQANLNFSWDSGLTACDFLTQGYTLPTRAMVRGASSSVGWAVTSIGFGRLWPSGFYQCGQFTTVGWVNTKEDYLLQNELATDSSGQNYSSSTIRSQSSIDSLICRGASWSCVKRFAQNVVEGYTLVVNSPQSQLLYGVRERNESASLQADYDTSVWEDESLYKTEFSGTKVAQSAANYYINQDTENTEFSNAAITALNKAKTSILASHRDTEISFTTFINPAYLLRHTISVNATRISAKGKVRGIAHKFSANGEATSKVRLALYRSVGSGSDTALTTPARPSFTAPPALGSVVLGSVWGANPSLISARNRNGYSGNKWVTTYGGGSISNTFKTTYQESFVVDAPTVPENRRKTQNYASDSSYDISIPNDTLTIIFLDS